MKKVFVVFVALLFVASLTTAALAQMTGDEIIAKYLEKTGGLAKYKALKTIKMEGKGFAGGQTFNIAMLHKAPDLFHMEMFSEMFKIVAGSDGKKVWQQIPMVPGYIFADKKDLPSKLEEMRMNPYLDYKARGATAKLIGEEPVKGIDCYKVEYISASGDTSNLFFTKDNFQLTKSQGKEGETLMSDFKDVNGISFPHKITQLAQGQTYLMIMSKVETNIPLADSLFVAPPDSLAAPPEALEQLKKMQQGAGQQQGGEKKQ